MPRKILNLNSYYRSLYLRKHNIVFTDNFIRAQFFVHVNSSFALSQELESTGVCFERHA